MTIRGYPKEIAALVVALQERQGNSVLMDAKAVAQSICDCDKDQDTTRPCLKKEESSATSTK